MSTQEFFVTDEINSKWIDQAQDLETQEYLDGINLFHKLPILHDMITASLIFCVGLVLNTLILRCYWSVKTSTTVFDILTLVYIMFQRIIYNFYQSAALITVWKNIGLFIFTNIVIGPLFMALDRLLIVAFPHNFKTHEKKMRIVKYVIIIVQNALSGVWCWFSITMGTKSLGAEIAVAVSTTLFALQCLSCITLYGVIVCKVRTSSRKICPDTHAQHGTVYVSDRLKYMGISYYILKVYM